MMPALLSTLCGMDGTNLKTAEVSDLTENLRPTLRQCSRYGRNWSFVLEYLMSLGSGHELELSHVAALHLSALAFKSTHACLLQVWSIQTCRTCEISDTVAKKLRFLDLIALHFYRFGKSIFILEARDEAGALCSEVANAPGLLGPSRYHGGAEEGKSPGGLHVLRYWQCHEVST